MKLQLIISESFKTSNIFLSTQIKYSITKFLMYIESRGKRPF